MINFAALLTEMTKLPECRTKFKEWQDGRIIYDVVFPKLKFSMTIPMPEMAVLLHVSEQRPAFSEDMPFEQAEAYLSSYKVRAVDALAYCFASPHDVPQIRQLFGSRYEEAEQLALQWWEAAQNA